MAENAWLSTDEAAQFLKTDAMVVEQMVRERLIPHTMLPVSGQPLFSTHRLDAWLQKRETLPHNDMGGGGATREALANAVRDRIHTQAVDRTRYTNLYAGTRVYAQLHEPTEQKKRVYDGVCLAIPEATSYADVPKVEFLEPIDVRDLAGYWKANKDWLEGNGQRFTKHKAVAYHIPLQLAAEPSHRGWTDVDNLLRYALGKLKDKSNSRE